jgi:macrocin-O-methyltransferase TylF-like protien
MDTGMIENIRPHADYLPYMDSLWGQQRHPKGDVAEFGCYRGGSARQLATLTGRTVYAWDTFTGLPAEDFTAELDIDTPGDFAPGATAAELFAGWPTIVPVIGRFADTLPKFPTEVRFAFVYIDCDLYESARQVLDWLPAHLSDGAVILLDDYNSHKGIHQAVTEFAADWKLKVTPIASSGAYVIWRPR